MGVISSVYLVLEPKHYAVDRPRTVLASFILVNGHKVWSDSYLLHKVAFTLYSLTDSSFWFDTISLGWFIIYSEWSQVILSK